MKSGNSALGAGLLALAISARAEEPAATVSYQKDIVPILEQNCATCHLTGEEERRATIGPVQGSRAARVGASGRLGIAPV